MKNKKVTEEGWYWWKLKPDDKWEPRYFRYNDKLNKFIIVGRERTPTRCSKEGMIGHTIPDENDFGTQWNKQMDKMGAKKGTFKEMLEL